MRIAHCSFEVQGIRGGGIGTYVGEAGRALRAAGHEVWLFTAEPDAAGTRALEALGAFDRIVFVDREPVPGGDPARFRFGLATRPYRFAQLCHEALVGCGVAFDWIEFPDYEAWGYVSVQEQNLLGTYGDAVLAVHLHSPTRECLEYNLQAHNLTADKRELCALEDDAIRRAPLRLCPSVRLREMVAERLGLGPAEHAAEILRYPMVLPPEWPAPPRPRAALVDLRVAYFGRIEPRKGVHTLVEAFRELPEVRLELIGADRPSSPWGTSLTQWLSRDLPANVTFRGALPRERLLEELRDIDVCIFPSLWENWPNVCLEAMAHARVVIGGRNGGMGEMIEHGVSGFVVDGSDPRDIARVVRDDLGGALGRLDAIGNAAARRVRELVDPAKYVARVEELCADARAGKSAKAAAAAQADGDAAALVTFLVPFYKEDAAVVGAAVDSALAQTHAHIEVLVVDDGSPRADRAEILAGLASKDERVRVLSKPNGGLASARNHGLEHARGAFVICLDADNLARPDYAATGLAVFARHPEVEALVPQFRVFDDRTGATQNVVGALPFDPALAYFRNESGDAGAMFRTSVFRERGLRYDPMVDAYSDWALWLDCAREGVVVRQLPRILYDYRRHGGSMMAETAWERHLPLVGLLIERHWVPLDEAQQKEAMSALLHGFGIGSILANLSGRASVWERPGETAHRLFGSASDVEAVAALKQVLDRTPILGPLANAVLRFAVRLHGRYKDRRRRRS
jgi:glycosyltransferase involved in cell wall biosynthesis